MGKSFSVAGWQVGWAMEDLEAGKRLQTLTSRAK